MLDFFNRILQFLCEAVKDYLIDREFRNLDRHLLGSFISEFVDQCCPVTSLAKICHFMGKNVRGSELRDEMPGDLINVQMF